MSKRSAYNPPPEPPEGAPCLFQVFVDGCARSFAFHDRADAMDYLNNSLPTRQLLAAEIRRVPVSEPEMFGALFAPRDTPDDYPTGMMLECALNDLG